jgi:hypothetical protein
VKDPPWAGVRGLHDGKSGVSPADVADQDLIIGIHGGRSQRIRDLEDQPSLVLTRCNAGLAALRGRCSAATGRGCCRRYRETVC